jgi:ribosome-associated protein
LQWIIVDFVDFVVHIFRDTAREFYNLERLWADAPTELIEDKPAPKKRATKKS